MKRLTAYENGRWRIAAQGEGMGTAGSEPAACVCGASTAGSEPPACACGASPAAKATLEAAAEKLAAFETLAEELVARQAQLSARLETLRAEGKTKTAQFRECMGEKLSNSFTLSLFQARGLL